MKKLTALTCFSVVIVVLAECSSHSADPPEKKEMVAKENQNFSFSTFHKDRIMSSLSDYYQTGDMSDYLTSFSVAYPNLDSDKQEILSNTRESYTISFLEKYLSSKKDEKFSTDDFMVVARAYAGLTERNSPSFENLTPLLSEFGKKNGKRIEDFFYKESEVVLKITKEYKHSIKPMSKDFLTLHKSYLNASFAHDLSSSLMSYYESTGDFHYDKSEELDYYYNEYLNTLIKNKEVSNYISHHELSF